MAFANAVIDRVLIQETGRNSVELERRTDENEKSYRKGDERKAAANEAAGGKPHRRLMREVLVESGRESGSRGPDTDTYAHRKSPHLSDERLLG